MKKRKNRQGLTIVELMIAVVLSAIVILTTTLILYITFRTWRSANISSQFRRDIALTVDYIAKDVRESSSADIDTTAGIRFLPNDVRPETDYTADLAAGTLVRTDNASAITLISGGLLDFDPAETQDAAGNVNGIRLRLVLSNDDFNIGITNETFISVRNR